MCMCESSPRKPIQIQTGKHSVSADKLFTFHWPDHICTRIQLLQQQLQHLALHLHRPPSLSTRQSAYSVQSGSAPASYWKGRVTEFLAGTVSCQVCQTSAGCSWGMIWANKARRLPFALGFIGSSGLAEYQSVVIFSQTWLNSRPRTKLGRVMSNRPKTTIHSVMSRPRKERGVISP